MDDVLVDTLSAQRAWFRAHHGISWSDGELRGRPLEALVPAEVWNDHLRTLHEGAFFADLPEMSGAVETARALCGRYEVFVTTAAMEFPASLSHKFGWLRRHLPFLDPLRIVFCGDKSVLDVDYLVDDSARHFRRLRGQGILFDAHHNAGVLGYPRVRGWDELGRVLLGTRAPDEVLAELVGGAAEGGGEDARP
jgi:5'(3')-deoxyribonucleotidase